MNALTTLNFDNTNGVKTMSSLELAKLCVGTKKNAHSHFIAKMKKVLGEEAILGYRGTYLSSQNKELVCYNLPEEQALLMIDSYRTREPYGLREKVALDTIEQLMSVKLERQYQLLNYRLDAYDPTNNTAYEIDEPQHFVGGVLRASCIERQKEIESTLGCTFVRIKV